MTAAVVVPIAALIGFLETNYLIARILTGYQGTRGLYMLTVLAGSVFAGPVSLVGHVILRWTIGRHFNVSKAL